MMSESSYIYVTEEVISEFQGSGAESLLETLESIDQSSSDGELIVVQLFTELLLVFEEDELDLNGLVNFLFSSIKNDLVARVFCQVVNVFPPSEHIKNLLQLISRKENVIKPETIAMYIGSDKITESELVPKQTLTKTLNTKMRDELYSQKKFNLLHEEIEGFSKFVTEIYFILKADDAEFQVEYAIQVIEKIIGHYSLDPNRCLEILLSILESQIVPKHRTCINLLKQSKWWPNIPSDNSSLTTLSIGGNEGAAKIIGLRFAKHASDRDLPETFKIMIGILIKEGFISFGALAKYLAPDDEEMTALEKDYKKLLDDEVNKAGASALALAAPLLEEDEETGKPKEKNNNSSKAAISPSEKFHNKLHLNMKFQFLRSFVSVGLYYPAVYLLTQYPFLAYADDEIIELINRLSIQIVSTLHDRFNPFSAEDFKKLSRSKKVAFARQQNHVEYEEFPNAELLSFKATIKSYSTKSFRFFYTEWSDQLPVLSTAEDLFAVSKEFIKFSGVNISKNLELFVMLCEVVVWDLKNNPEDADKKLEWFHYFRNYIFPAMSTIEEDSIAIDKAYEILSFYSLEDRFSVYGELQQVLAKNNPHVKMAYSKAEKATKDVLKRLSKENVRPMMRRLAKISFSNPLPCFLTILQQIESYDNLNSLVVETARYFNSYGWDNLTAAILMRLTSPGRTGTQDNGMIERQWLQSLASFIGKICQRYPRLIDLKTLFTYLLKSFHAGEHIGLIVLKEIFISMGGIQTITNLTLQQIDMLNCGNSLEKLVYRTIDDLRFERFRSGEYLIKSLLEIDGLNELLVLLCQYQSQLIAKADEFPLKVLASRIDDINAVIRLFITLTNFFGNLEELKEVYLPVSTLSGSYGVSTEWAFDLWRPYLDYAISKQDVLDPNLEQMINETAQLVPEDVLQNISQSLYVTFWRLSLRDINYSKSLYESETIKLKSNIRSLKDWVSINSRDKDVSISAIDKARKDLRQNEIFSKTIQEESSQHEIQNQKVLEILTTHSESWFSKDGDVVQQSNVFLQNCILPRAIHSSFDAVFSSRFLFKLNELSPNNFSLINVFDQLIKNNILFGTLFTLTPIEAENLGLFFADVLFKLHSWTKKETFDLEAAALTKDDKPVSFDNFRTILYEYHTSILDEIATALHVSEYMCRRNAITFLKNLLGIYPNVEDHCERVVELIEKVIKEEDREDLKLSSSALIGHVKSRSKEWVPIWDFIAMEEDEKNKLIEEKKQKEIALKAEKKRIEDERIKNELAKKAQELAKVKEEEEKKKLGSLLDYDSKKSSSRPDSRGSSTTQRGRYDNYTHTVPKPANGEEKKTVSEPKPKEEEKKDAVVEVTPLVIKPAETINVESKKEENKEGEKVTEKAIETKKIDTKENREATPTEKGSETSSPEKLKEKLAKAKKELEASRPSSAVGKDEYDPAGPSIVKRAPLPPQEALRNNDVKPVQHNSQYRPHGQYNRDGYNRDGYNNYRDGGFNRHNSNSNSNNPPPRGGRAPVDSLPLPPPPPPPPPPPAANNRNQRFGRDNNFNNSGRNANSNNNSNNTNNQNRRFDSNNNNNNKRRQDDGNYNRGYDKKAKY
ncbi:transcription factor/nuclear export subunit protein 2-domain-containing protein [Scheffersomyces coipomensis]|uniref:transcription factor/nuclear export subunit protein 2-domain-containing protein n=1 Tax=Scheffersomyces coipomensis TaxID=1788519 RepID=UPI00315D0B88